MGAPALADIKADIASISLAGELSVSVRSVEMNSGKLKHIVRDRLSEPGLSKAEHR